MLRKPRQLLTTTDIQSAAAGVAERVAPSSKEVVFCSQHQYESMAGVYDSHELLLLPPVSPMRDTTRVAASTCASGAAFFPGAAAGLPVPRYTGVPVTVYGKSTASGMLTAASFDATPPPTAAYSGASPPPPIIAVSQNAAAPVTAYAVRNWAADAAAAAPAGPLEGAESLPQPVQSALHALAGAAGALLSMVCVYPADYIRTVQSVTPGGSKSLLSLIKEIMSKEGPRGLYRGLRSALWGMVVGWGVYFFVYSYTRKNR